MTDDGCCVLGFDFVQIVLVLDTVVLLSISRTRTIEALCAGSRYERDDRRFLAGTMAPPLGRDASTGPTLGVIDMKFHMSAASGREGPV